MIYRDGSKIIEHVGSINDLPVQEGYLNSLGLFRTEGVTQTAITFDLNTTKKASVLKQVNRRSRETTKPLEGQKVKQITLALTYFKDSDYVTPEDVQGHMVVGTDGQPTVQLESKARLVAEKLANLRARSDMTHEYLQVQAIKGKSVDPEGNVLADMFAEAGISRPELNFELNVNTTDVSAKIRELKSMVATSISGINANGIVLLVSGVFFDALVKHPSVAQRYMLFSSSNLNRAPTGADIFVEGGLQSTFTMDGVTFVTYDQVFTLPDGTTECAFKDGEGFVVLRSKDVYRGWFGPANKLSYANTRGLRNYAFEYDNGRDEGFEIEVESAPLYIHTQPSAAIRVISQTGI